jgi:hypothetical protein
MIEWWEDLTVVESMLIEEDRIEDCCGGAHSYVCMYVCMIQSGETARHIHYCPVLTTDYSNS